MYAVKTTKAIGSTPTAESTEALFLVAVYTEYGQMSQNPF